MAEKHKIHKYGKIKIDSKRFAYACALPSCTRRILIDEWESRIINLGIESICWDCSSPFVINNPRYKKTAKPACDSCRHLRVPLKTRQKLADQLAEAGISQGSIIDSLLGDS
jgi:hypothetical protein